MRKRLFQKITSLHREGTDPAVIAQILLTAELRKSPGVDLDLCKEAITRAALLIDAFYYEEVLGHGRINNRISNQD